MFSTWFMAKDPGGFLRFSSCFQFLRIGVRRADEFCEDDELGKDDELIEGYDEEQCQNSVISSSSTMEHVEEHSLTNVLASQEQLEVKVGDTSSVDSWTFNEQRVTQGPATKQARSSLPVESEVIPTSTKSGSKVGNLTPTPPPSESQSVEFSENVDTISLQRATSTTSVDAAVLPKKKNKLKLPKKFKFKKKNNLLMQQQVEHSSSTPTLRNSDVLSTSASTSLKNINKPPKTYLEDPINSVPHFEEKKAAEPIPVQPVPSIEVDSAPDLQQKESIKSKTSDDSGVVVDKYISTPHRYKSQSAVFSDDAVSLQSATSMQSLDADGLPKNYLEDPIYRVPQYVKNKQAAEPEQVPVYVHRDPPIKIDSPPTDLQPLDSVKLETSNDHRVVAKSLFLTFKNLFQQTSTSLEGITEEQSAAEMEESSFVEDKQAAKTEPKGDIGVDIKNVFSTFKNVFKQTSLEDITEEPLDEPKYIVSHVEKRSDHRRAVEKKVLSNLPRFSLQRSTSTMSVDSVGLPKNNKKLNLSKKFHTESKYSDENGDVVGQFISTPPRYKSQSILFSTDDDTFSPRHTVSTMSLNTTGLPKKKLKSFKRLSFKKNKLLAQQQVCYSASTPTLSNDVDTLSKNMSLKRRNSRYSVRLQL